MIKVSIIGCDNLRSAELVRVLINHPDVELKWVSSAHDEGARLDMIVPGIVGECDLVVNANAELADVDVVFLCESRNQVTERLSALEMPAGMHFIDLSGTNNLDHGPDKPWTYGLSEMQRRILVHDAHLVTIPGSAATAALLALMPMARNLLINSPLTLQVAIGTAAFPNSGTTTIDGLDITRWTTEQQQEIALALGQCQSSFNQPIDLTITPLDERRTMSVTARLKCGVDDETIRQLYESYYDDHNFVFLVDRPAVSADVENTNKCLMTLDKDERSGELTVHAMMDALLKGCVGNAVHAMNLLFGLHERVGLTLKATGC